MSILLSIKPKYAEMIYNGSKDWELRKALYPNHACPISEGQKWPDAKVFLYETRPVKKITGWMTVDNFLWLMSLDKLWEYVKDRAGVTREEFDAYYYACKNPCAWHVRNAYRFDVPVDPYVVEGWRPPQFYHNVDNDIIRQLKLLSETY